LRVFNSEGGKRAKGGISGGDACEYIWNKNKDVDRERFAVSPVEKPGPRRGRRGCRADRQKPDRGTNQSFSFCVLMLVLIGAGGRESYLPEKKSKHNV